MIYKKGEFTTAVMANGVGSKNNIELSEKMWNKYSETNATFSGEDHEALEYYQTLLRIAIDREDRLNKAVKIDKSSAEKIKEGLDNFAKEIGGIQL